LRPSQPGIRAVRLTITAALVHDDIRLPYPQVPVPGVLIESTVMHHHQAAAIARRKTHLVAIVVLLAAGFAVGPTEAKTWKSQLSADTPDVIYRHHCSVCHGDKGDGKSLAQYALDPPPRDFTSEKARNELSRAHMIEVLNKGALTKAGKRTGMIAWKDHLSREQIEAVVDYVIVKFMDGKVVPNDQMHAEGHEHKGHDHSAANVKAADYPYGLKPDAVRGQSIYSANCVACHGEKGDGRGNIARRDALKPRNFHDADFRQFAGGFSLFSAISRGRGHMPAWDKTLSNQDIADVSEYVLRTFVKPHASHGK
jgi:mono/diheme cytochrome c family protein